MSCLRLLWSLRVACGVRRPCRLACRAGPRLDCRHRLRDLQERTKRGGEEGQRASVGAAERSSEVIVNVSLYVRVCLQRQDVENGADYHPRDFSRVTRKQAQEQGRMRWELEPTCRVISAVL